MIVGRSIIGGVVVALGLLGFMSTASAQDDLDVVFSCPIYDPGPPEVGNDPGEPSNPQDPPLTYNRMNVNGFVDCQILYGATGSQTLENIEFQVQFPETTLTYVDDQELPDGDPRSFYMEGLSGVVDTTVRVGEVRSIPSSFPGGVEDEAAGTYTWQIDSLAPGTTRELRFTMMVRDHVPEGQAYNITVSSSVEGQQGAPDQVVPMIKYYDYETKRLYNEIVPVIENSDPILSGLHGTYAFRGAGQHAHQERFETEIVMVGFLPYWDGTEVRADGLYDASNPAHEAIIDATQLEARFDGMGLVPFQALGYLGITVPAGSLFGPVSGGFNEGNIVRVDPSTMTIEVWFGRNTTTSVGWHAPKILNLPLDTEVPIQTCYTSRQRIDDPTQEDYFCSEEKIGVIGDNGEPRFIFNYVNPAVATGPENRPLLPLATFKNNMLIKNQASRVLSDLEMITQAPGDDQRRAFFSEVRAARLQEFEGSVYVSTTPSDYGNLGDLTARSIPQTAAGDWVLCAADIHDGCTRADLAALGINYEDVEEVRFVMLSDVPPWTFSPRLNRTQPYGAIGMSVFWELDESASSSMNGSGNTIIPDDMTETSVGNKMVASYTEFGHQRTHETAWNSNLDGGYRFYNAPFYPRNYGISIEEEVDLYTANILYNRGTLPNIFGPMEIEVTLPEGFWFDASAIYPGEPHRPYVRGYNSNVGYWNLDTSYFTYTYDETTREVYLSVELEDDNILYPLNYARENNGDEIEAIQVRFPGVARVGSPRRMESSTILYRMEGIDSAGDRVPFEVGGGVASLDLTNVSPAVNFTAVADPMLVGALGQFEYNYEVDNPAYEEDGTLIEDGATASARNSAIFQRITKGGDYPGVEQGFASATFVEAVPQDAVEVWVSTIETPTETNSAVAYDDASEWTLCWNMQTGPGTSCDAAALADIGLGENDIRWVSFHFDELRVTDAEPRGQAPRDGNTRINNAYQARLILADNGTNQDGIIRSRATYYSRDTVSTSTGLDGLDVEVNASCLQAEPGVGFGEVEVCDGRDNDCNGIIDDGFDVGDVCSVGEGQCAATGVKICAADGTGTICEARPGEPEEERCDGLDWDCDGEPYNGYDIDGACNVSFEGDGNTCEVPGSLICSGTDEYATICVYDQEQYPTTTEAGYPDICACSLMEGTECGTSFDGCSEDLTGTYICTETGLECDISSLDTTGNDIPDMCECEVFAGDACTGEFPGCSMEFDGVLECNAGDLSCDISFEDADEDGTPDMCDCEMAAGESCEVSFDEGMCSVEGTVACDAELEAYCDISEVPDADEDEVPDSCDCAPEDANYSTMLSGVEGSCDFDGDGFCAVGISGEPNLEFCADGFDDCNDEDEAINPGSEERCDELDWDCDGDAYNGYNFGETCADGEGQCAADGEYICSEDGFSTDCSAEAGEPAEEERCDDLDWTCDGDPLTGYPVGDVCEVELDDCTLAGAYICAEDGTMVCEPSLDECPADDIPDNPELEYEARGSGLGCSSSNGDAPAGEFVLLLVGLFALGAGRRRSSKRVIR